MGPVLTAEVGDKFQVSTAPEILCQYTMLTNAAEYLSIGVFDVYNIVICGLFQICPQIVFRNLASRPYNIYPSGLTNIRPLHGQGKTERGSDWEVYSFRNVSRT